MAAILSLTWWKAFLEEDLARHGYMKIPSGTREMPRGRVFGSATLGDSGGQLAAYQGHVYKCVTLIYRRAISVSMKLYKQERDKSEEVKRHASLDLMKRPNPSMSGRELKSLTLMHLDLTGKAFWLKKLNRLGRPSELWPLSPASFLGLLLDGDKNGIKGFEFQTESGPKIHYDADEIVYFHYPHPVYPFEGASPIQSQAFAYDIDRATKVYMRNFFRNSARPDVVLQTEQQIQEEDARRILLSWREAHQGFGRAWEPAILDRGLQAKTISMPDKDLVFAASAGLSKQDILEAYGVPEGKLGTIKGIDDENMAAIDVTFNSECIAPRLALYDEAINSHILQHYQEGLYVKHANPVPRDREFALKERELNLKTLTTTINEEREKMGLPPVPWGHTVWVPRSLTPMNGKEGRR